MDTWTRARVARGSWSTLRALGHVPKSPGTPGRPRRTSNPSPSPLRELVIPTVHRTRDRFNQYSWSTPGYLDAAPSRPGGLVESTDPGTQRESPGSAGQHCGPSDQGPSHPGQEVDPAGPQPRGRVVQDSCSTPRAHQQRPDSPGSAGRHCGPSDGGQGHKGLLVDTTGTWTLARVTWDSWSTLKALGQGPESPGRAGRLCGHLDMVPNRPGKLVDPAGPETRSRIPRNSW